LSYCEEVRALEERVRKQVESVAREAGAKVGSFTSECEERRRMMGAIALAPTKFKHPPTLMVSCEDRRCGILLRVRTSAAKAKEIESWARGKGLIATRAPLILRWEVLPPEEVGIEAWAPLEKVAEKVEELVRLFKAEVDR
jgi:hypothetical protein